MAKEMAKVHSEEFGDTIVKIIDKLAGKGSDLKLTFQDLTLDMGMMKTTLNGSITLDIVFAKET
jgi:hypothetical protein